jgi:outer membrane protein OmpA-like peptidoglycan-associated protein
MNRLLRPSVFAVLAAGGIAATASVAHANVEIGGMAGVHTFAHDNELGVNDTPSANSLRNSALFGLRLGVTFTSILGVEGELGIIPTEARNNVFDVWALTYRAHLIAQFGSTRPNARLIPFVLGGIGALQVVDNGGAQNDPQIAKDTDAAGYLGVGLKLRVANNWGLRLDGRLLFPPSSKGDGVTEDFELMLSVYKEFGRKQPEPPKPVVDNDPDRDGVVGGTDQCPNEAEDKDGFQDDDGCPDPDNDGDGVLDAADQCPSEAEDKDGFQDDDGCPDLDNDGDGILDAADKCPNEAEDKDGFQDDDGCPDLDNDGDGVADVSDKCPNEPETKNGFQDDDGCPDELPAKLKQFTGAIQGINFKVGDSALQATSNATLDRAVAVLKEFADLKMEVQGHTDDQPLKAGGKFASNTALSQARADAVKAYFVAKGIDESRLTAKGYGETIPVEDPKGLTAGKLNAARAKNRRVEFKLLSELTK